MRVSDSSPIRSQAVPESLGLVWDVGVMKLLVETANRKSDRWRCCFFIQVLPLSHMVVISSFFPEKLADRKTVVSRLCTDL